MSKTTGLKVTAFILALILGVLYLNGLMLNQGVGLFQWINGIYEERKDSVDAVYVGSSSVYEFFMPACAWQNYGISVYTYACSGAPLDMAEYMIKEARKTQPDSVYIIGVNVTPLSRKQEGYETYSLGPMHYLMDPIDLSKNKIDMFEKCIDQGGYSFGEALEFLFPLLRYHARWTELGSTYFDKTNVGPKSWYKSSGFFTISEDLTNQYRSTSRLGELPESLQASMESLLSYLDAENIQALFVVSPQARNNEDIIAQYNTICAMAESRGYPALDMNECQAGMHLDPARDFSMYVHTNVHGATKFTNYISEYLVENYGFSDKRGDSLYADWEEAAREYNASVAPYVLDYEWNGLERDYALSPPKLTKISANGTTLTLSWGKVNGATGYCIYRKTGNGPFELLEDVDKDTNLYVDKKCTETEKYTYTVVSYHEEGGKRYWGTYDYAGLSATATINAPQNITNAGVTDALTIRWDPVTGADGYQVARRVLAKGWVTIADAWPGTSYLDTDMLEGLPYQYRVRAYWNNEVGEHVYGSWSNDTLYCPELPGPAVTATLVDGVPVLNWPAMEGISNYTVERRTGDGDWEQIAEPLAADCVQFRDLTARAGVSYEYRVTANVVYAKQTYPSPSEPVQITAQAGPVALEPPEILFCEQVGDTVQLVWEPSANATAYRVYRTAEGEETWTVVNASAAGSSCQDRPSAAGTYAYTLQPLRSEDGCVYYGTFDESTAKTVDYGE